MGPILALIQVEVMDAEKFREYVKGHLPTIELYGGKVILKSAGMEVIEGAWMPELFVIHEWPGVAAFKRWMSQKNINRGSQSGKKHVI